MLQTMKCESRELIKFSLEVLIMQLPNSVQTLIDEITTSMDAGSFNLVRSQSIQRINRARIEREVAQRQNLQVQALNFNSWQ